MKKTYRFASAALCALMMTGCAGASSSLIEQAAKQEEKEQDNTASYSSQNSSSAGNTASVSVDSLSMNYTVPNMMQAMEAQGFDHVSFLRRNMDKTTNVVDYNHSNDLRFSILVDDDFTNARSIGSLFFVEDESEDVDEEDKMVNTLAAISIYFLSQPASSDENFDLAYEACNPTLTEKMDKGWKLGRDAVWNDDIAYVVEHAYNEDKGENYYMLYSLPGGSYRNKSQVIDLALSTGLGPDWEDLLYYNIK